VRHDARRRTVDVQCKQTKRRTVRQKITCYRRHGRLLVLSVSLSAQDAGEPESPQSWSNCLSNDTQARKRFKRSLMVLNHTVVSSQLDDVVIISSQARCSYCVNANISTASSAAGLASRSRAACQNSIACGRPSLVPCEKDQKRKRRYLPFAGAEPHFQFLM
jgi:hypothetical protein